MAESAGFKYSPMDQYHEEPPSYTPSTTISQTGVGPACQQPPSVLIINQQPRSGETKQGEWTVGLCDCFADCSEFLCSCFCPVCQLCSLHYRADEGCCSCIFSPLYHLRTKVRVERGIYGSLCEDITASLFCPLCVMIQTGVEMKRTYPRI